MTLKSLLASLVLASLAVSARAQDTDVLFSDDLEDGIPDSWSAPDAQWQLVPDGTCGVARTWMFATSDPAACVTGPGAHSAVLGSDAFMLTVASEPFRVEFDYQLQMDSDDSAEFRVFDLTYGIWSQRFPLANTSGPTHFEAWIAPPQMPFVLGGGGVLEFRFDAGPAGNTGFGWLVDNVRASYGNWSDLGSAKPGSNGKPALTGSGLLVAGASNHLALSSAAPTSPATLVVGLSRLDAPFKGGVLVPQPQWLVPLVTDGLGALDLPFTLPPGLAKGTLLYFQFWIMDAGASSGLSASNALEGKTLD